MNKFYLLIIGLFICLLSLEESWAQCPQQHEINVQSTDARSFQEGKGSLLFSISTNLAFNRKDYRIRLWNHDTQRYIYDDNNPEFLNLTKVKVDQHKISFDSLPKGNYALELHGGSCQYTRFEADGHSETKSK